MWILNEAALGSEVIHGLPHQKRSKQHKTAHIVPYMCHILFIVAGVCSEEWMNGWVTSWHLWFSVAASEDRWCLKSKMTIDGLQPCENQTEIVIVARCWPYVALLRFTTMSYFSRLINIHNIWETQDSSWLGTSMSHRYVVSLMASHPNYSAPGWQVELSFLQEWRSYDNDW